MLKSVEAFRSAAQAKKVELERRHSDAMAKILELQPGESVAEAFAKLVNYLSRRMDWLARWWSDIYGPKVENPKMDCHGRCGTVMCGSDTTHFSIWLKPVGDVFDISIKSNSHASGDQLQYFEDLPRVRDVKFDNRYPGDIKFEIFCSPEEVKEQLVAFKKACEESENVFEKVYKVAKRMKAWEIDRETKDTDKLTASLEGI